MPTTSIAVAVATMNRPDGLRRCLDAVFAGDMLPSQVIVVDQSSDEITTKLLEHYESHGVPLEHFRQPRLGLSASRNSAFTSSRTSIVAMTDDDCIPSPGWLRGLAGAFAGPSQPAAVTGRILPYGDDVAGTFAVSSRPSTTSAEYRGKAPPWHVASGGNFAVLREAWESVGGFDERLGAGSPGQAGEDLDFGYRLLRAGCTIRYDPDVLLFHERQSAARRAATRWTYGYGAGAFCGKWLRAGDPYALRLLQMWMVWRGREWAGALIRGQRLAAGEGWTMLSGTGAGLVYGLSFRGGK